MPTRSASGPSRRRKTAPPSGGTATTRPFAAGDRPRSSATYAPSAPSSTQHMNETSKWMSAAARLGVCPA